MTCYSEDERRTAVKVLLVISGLGPGGAERVMTILAQGLVDRGHRVVLLTLSGRESDFFAVPQSVERIALDIVGDSRTPLHGLRANVRRVCSMRRAMAAVQPDVVLSFLTSVNVLAICASAGLDARVVVSERVDPRSHRPYGPWGILRDFAYRHADVVVAQTEEAAEWFRVRLRGRTRVEAIANPVGAMNPPPEADHSIPKPFILSVGRLVHQKGFDVLIRAFEIAAPDLLELHLAIVGEGETEHELRRQIAGAGLGARISLLGRSAAVPLLMKDAVALVMPSRYEGFPNVLLEALANRLPIVSTDCPSGPREILRNGEYGLLAPVENPHALAAAIVRIVRDTDLRHRFAELGPVAASRYDVAAIVALWERALSR